MTNPEVVGDNTHPAGTPYQNCSNDLTDDADRLLEDVEYAPNSANETCQIKNSSHFIKFKLNNRFSYSYQIFLSLGSLRSILRTDVYRLIVLHIAEEQSHGGRTSTRTRQI